MPPAQTTTTLANLPRRTRRLLARWQPAATVRQERLGRRRARSACSTQGHTGIPTAVVGTPQGKYVIRQMYGGLAPPYAQVLSGRASRKTGPPSRRELTARVALALAVGVTPRLFPTDCLESEPAIHPHARAFHSRPIHASSERSDIPCTRARTISPACKRTGAPPWRLRSVWPAPPSCPERPAPLLPPLRHRRLPLRGRSPWPL